MAAKNLPDRPAPQSPKSLSGLIPFLKPYRLQIGLALVFLVLAAASTLVFPIALRQLIDNGLQHPDPGAQAMALRGNFLMLFGVAVALGLFSAARFFTVSWLGERVTTDLRNAVYAHVLKQSPAFFETTPTGEVISRLVADTTLVQTVVGSSLSMGLRNAVMGIGALGMLVWAHPTVMLQLVVTVVLVVWPATVYGRRVRRLSRASQDRVADSSSIATEILNAMPVVQSYTAEEREAQRFATATEQGFQTAIRRTRARSVLRPTSRSSRPRWSAHSPHPSCCFAAIHLPPQRAMRVGRKGKDFGDSSRTSIDSIPSTPIKSCPRHGRHPRGPLDAQLRPAVDPA